MLTWDGGAAQKEGYQVCRVALDVDESFKRQPRELYATVERDKSFPHAREVTAKEGCKFFPCPRSVKGQRENVLLAAPAGAGKSTYVVNWCASYRKIYPNRPILFFSTKPEDDKIDAAKDLIERIPRSEWDVYLGKYMTKKSKSKKRKAEAKEGEEPAGETEEIVALDLLRKTCFVFDDFEMDPRIGDIRLFRRVLMMMGRSYQIDILSCTHQITKFSETRDEINELTALVIFPQSGIQYQCRYFLKRYLNYSDEEADKVLDLDNHDIYISVKVPIFCLTPSKVFILK